MLIFKFLIAVILTFNFFTLSGLVRAADLEITCSQKECLKSTEQPLFSSNDGLWYPGKSISKIIIIKNEGQTEKEVNLQNSKKYQMGNLENVLNVTLTNNQNKNIIWRGSLKNLNGKKSVSLGKIRANESLELITTLAMAESAPLDFQSQKAIFDLTFNFTADQRASQNRSHEKGNVLGESTVELGDQGLVFKLIQIFQDLLSKFFNLFGFLGKRN
ncbi:MAG: hypothetical protein PHQ59_03320 [Candidatus Daviesbacteria bacterium]|nr:hypothetical protein [Candidatus Daviesbacteria bacterium]